MFKVPKDPPASLFTIPGSTGDLCIIKCPAMPWPYQVGSSQPKDLKLFCSDGVVEAHKLIVRFVSPWLNKLLEGLDESEYKGIDTAFSIPEVTQKQMLQLLDLAYGNEIVCEREHYASLTDIMKFLDWAPQRSLRMSTVISVDEGSAGVDELPCYNPAPLPPLDYPKRRHIIKQERASLNSSRTSHLSDLQHSLPPSSVDVATSAKRARFDDGTEPSTSTASIRPQILRFGTGPVASNPGRADGIQEASGLVNPHNNFQTISANNRIFSPDITLPIIGSEVEVGPGNEDDTDYETDDGPPLLFPETSHGHASRASAPTWTSPTRPMDLSISPVDAHRRASSREIISPPQNFRTLSQDQQIQVSAPSIPKGGKEEQSTPDFQSAEALLSLRSSAGPSGLHAGSSGLHIPPSGLHTPPSGLHTPPSGLHTPPSESQQRTMDSSEEGTANIQGFRSYESSVLLDRLVMPPPSSPGRRYSVSTIIPNYSKSPLKKQLPVFVPADPEELGAILRPFLSIDTERPPVPQSDIGATASTSQTTPGTAPSQIQFSILSEPISTSSSRAETAEAPSTTLPPVDPPRIQPQEGRNDQSVPSSATGSNQIQPPLNNTPPPVANVPESVKTHPRTPTARRGRQKRRGNKRSVSSQPFQPPPPKPPSTRKRSQKPTREASRRSLRITSKPDYGNLHRGEQTHEPEEEEYHSDHSDSVQSKSSNVWP